MAIEITGMDRMAAVELQELFDAEGLAGELELSEAKVKTGRPGSLEALTAVLTDHSSSAVLLLLTSWIVSKKSTSLTFIKRDPKTSEEKTFKFQYKQDGPLAVLKELKSMFSDG